MKRLFLSTIAIIILTACSSAEIKAVPDIQKSSGISTKSAIQRNNLQANLLDTTNKDEAKNNEPDIKGIVDRINKNIEQKNITDDDINRGWYYGTEDEKKWGTPANWMWVNEGEESNWISPKALEQKKNIEIDTLCRKTGGNYAISCVESDLPHCEHIAKNECRCSDNTKWINAQGCILINDKEEFVKIKPSDLKQGWYYAGQSGKRLDTPASWIWIENGLKSQWQNPGAL